MSGIVKLIPLFILFAVIGVFAYVGYQIFIWSGELADQGKKKLEKTNMSFTQEGGLKVNVRHLSSESVADKTQNVLVNTWNAASFPNYKSKLGWNSTQADEKHRKSSPSSTPRPGASRQSSDSDSRSRPTGSRTTSSALRAPEHRSSAKRSTSPVPGGWD